MADEAIRAEGAEPEVDQIEANEQQDAATDNQKQTIDMDAVNKMLEERDKKWQSRFDKILAEKKAEENKAMTVEQRIEQLEQERQRERLDWTRKEARATAQIDPSLEEAIISYASNEPEKIQAGAKAIREFIDSSIAEYKSRADELEKQVRYTGAAPTGGGKASGVDFAKMNIDDVTAFVKKSPENMKLYREWQIKKK